MLRKLAALMLLVVPFVLAFPAEAEQGVGPGIGYISGVVRMDPHLYAQPSGLAQPAGPDVALLSNKNTTNNLQAQNETTIDVSPINTRNLVGGFNDYRTAANNDANCGYSHSSDGGTTWTSGIVNGITKGNGGPFTYDAAGDPSIYYAAYPLLNGYGTAYYACLAFDRNNARSALLLVSSASGNGFGTPTIIVQSNSISLFHDKEMLTVDNSTSTFFGRLYVEWTEFVNNFASSKIVISYSADHGQTWSTPATLSSSQHTVEGASPAVGPDGTVYAVWCFSSQYCEGNVSSTLYVSKSTNGGVTWSAPVAAATFTGLKSPLPGNQFRVNSFPTVAVNQNNGQVYIAYADYASGNADIKFVRSTDHGTTWSTPIRVNSRTQDDQFFQWMRVAYSGAIWICYYDQSWNTTNWLDMSCSRSTTGTSFETAIRTTTVSSNPANDGFGGTFIGDYTGVTTDYPNSLPRPLWTDTRTGNAEAFAAIFSP